MVSRLKLLVIGNTGKEISDAYSWFVKNVYEGGSLLGHDVKGIDFKTSTVEQIRSTVLSYRPEIIFTHLTDHCHELSRIDEVMELFAYARKRLHAKVVHYVFDAINEPRYAKDLSYGFDCAFVSQTRNQKKFSKIWNIPVHFSQYACQKYKKMGKKTLNLGIRNSLVYTGNINSYPRGRGKLLKDLQRIMDLQIFVTQTKNDLRKKTLELAATAKVILSVSSGYEIKHFMDTRPWQYLGAGAFLIQKVFKNMEDIIPLDLFIPVYRFDAYEIKSCYISWLGKDKERDKIKRKAFNFMQKFHSCDRRMKDTIDVIMNDREKVRIFLKDL